MREARSELQRLDDFDRWLVVTHWRALLWEQRFELLPFPVKFGLVHTVVVLGCLPLMPPANQLPHIFVFVLWPAAFAFSLSICMLLPRRRLKIGQFLE